MVYNIKGNWFILAFGVSGNPNFGDTVLLLNITMAWKNIEIWWEQIHLGYEFSFIIVEKKIWFKFFALSSCVCVFKCCYKYYKWILCRLQEYFPFNLCRLSKDKILMSPRNQSLHWCLFATRWPCIDAPIWEMSLKR